MYRPGSGIDGAIRLQVQMQVVTGEPALPQFHTPDLDDPITTPGVQTSGFGIQDYLSAHRGLLIGVCSSGSAHRGLLIGVCSSGLTHRAPFTNRRLGF
jgi:hypothetical protein